MVNGFKRAPEASGEAKHIRWHLRARRAALRLTSNLTYGSAALVFWNRRALNILRDAAMNESTRAGSDR
jgi:hypothetical protein